MRDDLPPENETACSLSIDVAKYQAMLDASDLDEDQKHQFIEAMWQVMVAIVDWSFSVHPIQLACGQVDKVALERPAAKADVLNSSHSSTSDFTAASEAERDERT